MKLVITEKPSVAVSIAKVIGANQRKQNYYEGSGYKVSWCVGHLITIELTLNNVIGKYKLSRKEDG